MTDTKLSRPKMKNLSCDFETLKTIVDTNDKQRYKLLYEPNTTSDLSGAVDAVVNEPPPDNSNGTWWIRANQGHTLAVSGRPGSSRNGSFQFLAG